jgi:hypothetical protein
MWGTSQCHTKMYHTECAFHPPLQMGAFRHSLVIIKKFVTLAVFCRKGSCYTNGLNKKGDSE